MTGEGVLRHQTDPLIVMPALAALTCVPLLWRDRAPLATLLMVGVGLIGCIAVFHPYDTAPLVLMVPLYSVAVSGDRRRSLLVGAITAIVVAMLVWILQSSADINDGSTRLLLVLGALVVGDLVRSRRALRAAARERAAHEAREQEERSRRRAARERLGVARELHDTLAHALVAINVRAGVAAHLGAGEDGTHALTEIKHVSAQALHDLRATLDVLREPDAPAPTVPALDLAALPQLIERARAAGLNAEAELELHGASIPSPVGQAGFRIVQESLTNVLRHAQASETTVRITTTRGQLEIEVTDNGTGAETSVDPAKGHGLRGMIERATALGGSVSAGPISGLGWRVRATLPLAHGQS